MSRELAIVSTVDPDGNAEPSAFQNKVRAIDCIALLDGTAWDAQRLVSKWPEPANPRRSYWDLGNIKLEITEDGTHYRLAWSKNDAPFEVSLWPLKSSLVPKLAMAILMTFRSVSGSNKHERL